MFEYRETAVVSAEVIAIGPEKATEMLLGNEGNRTLRTRIVTEYSEYMKNGLWRENGEALRISDDGVILNGQHRLHAIISANMTIKFLVVTIKATDGKGPLTPMSVIQDRGTMRSHSDITGIPNNCDAVAGNMIREMTAERDSSMLSKNTALRASVYYEFESEMNYFFDRCNTSLKKYSQASIRAIIIMRLKQGYDYTDKYHSILTNLVGLPTSWMSWYRRIGSLVGGTRDVRREALVATWMLTDPARDDSKNLVIRSIDDQLDEIKAQFDIYCGHIVRDLASRKNVKHNEFTYKG